MSDRDTQFAGFARALVDDIRRNIDANTDLRLPYEQLIARRAYDLVKHAITDAFLLASIEEIRACVSNVSDMAELPEDEK